eukprot:jgi/Phyca11/536771/estExt2_fgenesh1_pg.C_PHYCAscaffold_620046
MLRARRLVTLWQRAQPATDASLQRLSMRLSRVDVSSTSVLSQRRWMSSESMNNVPFETNEAMAKVLEELDACRETGKWRQALKLLDRVDKDEALPALDPAMYERAIASCARMGKVEVLPGLLNNMLVDDLTPTSATIDFIIQAYLAKEHWGLIVQLASEATAMGVQLSPAAFNAIMEACGQVKDADSTMSIMTQLSEAGMQLTTDHYAAAIRAAGMSRRADTAMALFVQMEERDGLKGNAEAFSQLIRAQTLNGQLEQALQSYSSVTQRRLSLEEPIYTSTIDMLVSNGKFWQATCLFEQMLESGEKHPSVFSVDLFDEYVDSCKESRRVSRYVGIYLALFNALSRDTMRDPALNTRDAKRAWSIMSNNVPVVLPPAYASLAGVFASTGEMETLEELIDHAERSWGATAEEIQEPEFDEDGNEVEAVAVFDGEDMDLGSDNDVLLFNGVISGLSKARDDQTANIEAYLQMIRSRGLPITDSIVRATTDACIRFENWKLLRKLMKMIDVDALKNAEICTGDTVSKLLEDAVDYFDEGASTEMFDSLINQLCKSDNPVLAATLVVKQARLKGLASVHPNRVKRVTNELIEKGDLVEAEKLLQLYLDGTNGLSLKQTPPYFQQHTLEMLLFIYGEFGHFNAMRALFEKELLAFPLEVAHYEAAMEYCADSRDELAGAVASLKLFENLRTHGFVRPSGYSYLLTLQSCLRLERLEPSNASAVRSTGQVILADVQEHGFQKAVAVELTKQVASAIKQTAVTNQKVVRRINKKGEEENASVIKPEELARIALFCHRHGTPMTAQLATDLLKLHQHLPAMISNELSFIKRSLEEGLGVVAAPGSRASIPTKRVVK